MAAIASLSLDDREDTPVTHTFVPNGIDSGTASWKESDALGNPIGDNTFSVSYRKTASGLHKVRTVLRIPAVVVETIDGVARQKVERVAYANLEFTFAGDSTEQERENILGILSDALAADQSVLNPLYTKLESIY